MSVRAAPPGATPSPTGRARAAPGVSAPAPAALGHPGRSAAETGLRILAAADELFDSEGFRAAGVDGIAARAGVAKRTLYRFFRSKDDLVAACLRKRDETTSATFEAMMGTAALPLEERIEQLFGKLAALAGNPRWKGCGFARAAAELAGLPGHPGAAAARDHKARFEGLLAEAAAAAGIPGHASLGRRLMIVVEGALSQGLVHHDPSYALAAGSIARDLVASARSAGSS